MSLDDRLQNALREGAASVSADQSSMTRALESYGKRRARRRVSVAALALSIAVLGGVAVLSALLRSPTDSFVSPVGYVATPEPAPEEFKDRTGADIRYRIASGQLGDREWAVFAYGEPAGPTRSPCLAIDLEVNTGETQICFLDPPSASGLTRYDFMEVLEGPPLTNSPHVIGGAAMPLAARVRLIPDVGSPIDIPTIRVSGFSVRFFAALVPAEVGIAEESIRYELYDSAGVRLKPASPPPPGSSPDVRPPLSPPPACRRGEYKLVAEVEGATGSLVAYVSAKNSSGQPCFLGLDVTLEISDARGTRLQIVGNPSRAAVPDRLMWQWSNWCGNDETPFLLAFVDSNGERVTLRDGFSPRCDSPDNDSILRPIET